MLAVDPMPSISHGGPASASSLHIPPHTVKTTNQVLRYEGNRINQYRLGEKIGKGQNGTVITATMDNDDDTETVVAIKFVRRESRQGRTNKRYEQLRQKNFPRSENHTTVGDAIHSEENRIRKEIAVMKKLFHPHIVQLYEVLDDRLIQTIYLVMEYCEGGEVEWKDHNNQPTSSLEQTRRIMRDAIQGLDYLHTQGIIHRDIKPANLLWTKDRAHVKIADFGSAHFSYAQRLGALGGAAANSDDPNDDKLFWDDKALAKKAGTPMFMAPEVIFDSVFREPGDTEPEQPITKAIDVWSLGVTFYCLLFGDVPFHNTDGGLTGEFQIYRLIHNGEWEPREFMGREQIPTQLGNEDEDSEPGIILHLLYHLLAKYVTHRITLDEVKTNPWFSSDLPNPVVWMQSGVPQISVSTEDTEVAIQVTDMKIWTKVAQGVSKGFNSLILGFRRDRTQRENRDRGRRRDKDKTGSKLTSGHKLLRHQTDNGPRHRPRQLGGKQRESSVGHLRSFANLSRPTSRKDPAPSKRSSKTQIWPASRSSQSTTPTGSPEDSDTATRSSRRAGPSFIVRKSEEALGYNSGGARVDYPGGHLERARRVSSWDHPQELRGDGFLDAIDARISCDEEPLKFKSTSSDELELDDGDELQARRIPYHLQGELYPSRSREKTPSPLPPPRVNSASSDEGEDYGMVSDLHPGGDLDAPLPSDSDETDSDFEEGDEEGGVSIQFGRQRVAT